MLACQLKDKWKWLTLLLIESDEVKKREKENE